MLKPLTVFADGNRAASALAALVREAAPEQYNEIVLLHMEELENVPLAVVTGSDNQMVVAKWMDEKRVPALLQAWAVVVGTGNHDGKESQRWLGLIKWIMLSFYVWDVGRKGWKRLMPRLFAKLAQVVQVTTSMAAVEEVLRLSTRMVADKVWSMIISLASVFMSLNFVDSF